MNGGTDTEPMPVVWLRYAETDLTLMYLALSNDHDSGEVCFHAQQATEKALKAMLMLQQMEPPRIHDLVKLHSLVDSSVRPDADVDQLDRLTDLEAEARYPGEWPEPTEEDAAWASELADSVVQAVRAGFP